MLDPADKLPAIVPDFFHELIARIVPGLVVIILALYWSGSNLITLFSSAGQSVLVLVIAWVVGITLDTRVYSVGRFVITVLKIERLGITKFVKTILGRLGITNYDNPVFERLGITKSDPLKYKVEKEPSRRAVIKKLEASAIFFRTMFVISFSTLFTCLLILFSNTEPNCVLRILADLLPVLAQHAVGYSALAPVLCIAYIGCWYGQTKANCFFHKSITD